MLVTGSLFLVLLDICGGLPFLMSVKPSQRTEMSAVYSSFAMSRASSSRHRLAGAAVCTGGRCFCHGWARIDCSVGRGWALAPASRCAGRKACAGPQRLRQRVLHEATSLFRSLSAWAISAAARLRMACFNIKSSIMVWLNGCGSIQPARITTTPAARLMIAPAGACRQTRV